jgi:hypothetical protein
MKPKKRLTPKNGVSYDLQKKRGQKPQQKGVSHESLCRFGCFFENSFYLYH